MGFAAVDAAVGFVEEEEDEGRKEEGRVIGRVISLDFYWKGFACVRVCVCVCVCASLAL